MASRPGDRLEQREQLEVLSAAIGELPDRQREVFVAIALNDVPIDVLALERPAPPLADRVLQLGICSTPMRSPTRDFPRSSCR